MHAQRTCFFSLFARSRTTSFRPAWRGLCAAVLGLGLLLCGHARAAVAAPPICAAYSAFLTAPTASCGHQAVYAAMAASRAALQAAPLADTPDTYAVAQADGAKDPATEPDAPPAASEPRATPAGTKARCDLLEARTIKLDELVRKHVDEPTVAWALQEKERTRAEAARLGC